MVARPVTLGGRRFGTVKAAKEEHRRIVRHWTKPRPAESEPLTGFDFEFARSMAWNTGRYDALVAARAPITVRWVRPEEVFNTLHNNLWIGGDLPGAERFGARYVVSHRDWRPTDGEKRAIMRKMLRQARKGVLYERPMSALPCADCGGEATARDHAEPSYFEIAEEYLTGNDLRFENTPVRGRALTDEWIEPWIAFHDSRVVRLDHVCKACHERRDAGRRARRGA